LHTSDEIPYFITIYFGVLLHGEQNGGTHVREPGAGIFVLVPLLQVIVHISCLLHV